MNAVCDRIVLAFETLSPESLVQLGAVYAPDARFKDPFNEVQGLASIQHIFRDMFDRLDVPRFVVTTCILQGQECFLGWEFHFGFKGYQRGRAQCIRGGTHLVLDAQGLIILHRDYWDAAEELYEKLPWVGSLMRWLKRRFSH